VLVALLFAAPLVVYFAHAKRKTELNSFDRFVLSSTAFIERGVAWGVTGGWTFVENYLALRNARERAAVAMKESIALRLRLNEIQDARLENERLRKLLAFF